MKRPESVHVVCQYIIDHAKIEFAELADTWKILDQKAQGTTAIVGIFFAVAAAVVSGEFPLQGALRVGYVAAITCFVVAAIAAISVLMVRSCESIEAIQDVRTAAEAVFSSDSDDTAADALEAFYKQRAVNWEEINRALHNVTTQKAGLLKWAQVLLLLGTFLLGTVYILGMICGSP